VADSPRRWFFAPSRDGTAWDLVEATRTPAGWELRRPGRIAQETLPQVPPAGAGWKEVRAPERSPKVPRPPKPSKPAGPNVVEARERPSRPARARVPAVKAPAEPERKAKPPQPKAVPGLSKALEGLLQEDQMRQAAPAGMVKCPLCGLPLAPTRNRKVRTHENPLTGARCPASGTPWPSAP
jgi:hypothetical protein